MITRKKLRTVLESQLLLLWQSKLDKLERKMVNALRAYFARQGREIIAAYKKTGALQYDAKRWQAELAELLTEHHLAGIRYGFDRMRAEYEAMHGKTVFGAATKSSDADDQWRSIEDNIILTAQHQIGLLIRNIDDTTRTQVQKLVGVSAPFNDLTVNDVAARLSQLFDQFKGRRALTIARTEMSRAANIGYSETAKQLGYTRKRWLTALDENVCPVCGPLNGKVVAMTGDFSIDLDVGGKKVTYSASLPPMHPNCRCTVISEHALEPEKPKARPQIPDNLKPVSNPVDKETRRKWRVRARRQLDNHDTRSNPIYLSSVVDDNEMAMYDFAVEYCKEKSADDLDACVAKTLDALDETLQDALVDTYKAAHLYKATNPDTLRRVLFIDGRFKNQFETGTSEGYFDPDFRRGVEDDLFGVNGLPDQARAIYGFWAPFELTQKSANQLLGRELLNNVRGYGAIFVEFKDGVKNRTSLTFGDSLDDIYHGLHPGGYITAKKHDVVSSMPLYITQQVLQPSWPKNSYVAGMRQMKESLTPDEMYRTILNNVSYGEAQMWGTVGVEDIKRVIIYRPALTDSQLEELIQLLKKAKIKYDIIE